MDHPADLALNRRVPGSRRSSAADLARRIGAAGKRAARFALRLRTWSRSKQPRVPGYTLLVPVPGDLPVFADLALRVCRTLDHERRVETLLIPDAPSPACEEILERERPTWPGGSLRLVRFGGLERHVHKLRNPNFNHCLQIVNGTEQARGTHAVLHDADLFILSASAIERRFDEALRRDLSFFGAEQAYFSWFQEDAGRKIAGTWELIFDVEAMMRFPPSFVLGTTRRLRLRPGGQEYLFDNTHYVQFLTAPEKVDFDEAGDEHYVHFNGLITAYRFFQNGTRAGEDPWWKLLTIRLLHDVFRPGRSDCAIPPVEMLVRGLHDHSLRPFYGARHIRVALWFRGKIERLLTGQVFSADEVATLRARLAPFDAHFAEALEQAR